MAMRTFLICVFVSALIVQYTSADRPCPFNPTECACIDGPDNTTYDSVTCVSSSGAVVNFEVSSESPKYKVNVLSITGNVADLPANYFGAFSSLSEVSLRVPNRTPRPYQVQNWNRLAFDGVDIGNLYTYGLSNVLPPATALSTLAPHLRGLSISGGDPIRLYNFMMKDFVSLNFLSFYQVNIVQIGDRAFDGLEKRLTEITLVNTSCLTTESRSFNAFKKLKNLDHLTLINTGIIDYPKSAFSVFPDLFELKLQELDGSLIPAISAGALLNLPSKLSYLDLTYSGLTEIPELSYAQASTSKLRLNLYGNKFIKVTAADMEKIKITYTLDLSYNPITTIEKPFPNIYYINFSNISLTSLDLSIIANVRTSDFSKNPNLKSIYVSDLSQAFKGVSVNVYDGLETIDSQVGNVLLKNPDFQLDLSNGNSKLNCNQLNWMAPFVLCSKQVKVSDKFVHSTCSNGQLADDYFKNLEISCTQFIKMINKDRFANKKVF